MTTPGKLLTLLLTPLSWIYRGTTEIRNKLFDLSLLPQKEYAVPVICVGNLQVGGTGKTPMVEMLLSHLQSDYRIGVVSRGYRRCTRGFLIAGPTSVPDSIGDEPYQMYRKYGKRVRFAVCEKRTKGIDELLRLFPDINLIILDDAFQHRYVKSKINIMLMDYSRPVYTDKPLPLGRLREHISGMNRADFVVVSKCPVDMLPIHCRLLSDRLSLLKYQKLYFSSVRYMPVQPLFEQEAPYTVELSHFTSADTLLLLTGIANPRPLLAECRRSQARIKVMYFPDHHRFSHPDLQRLLQKFNQLKGARKIIITTEKDGGRLLHNPYFPQELKPYIFILPIEHYLRTDRTIGHSDFFTALRAAIQR